MPLFLPKTSISGTHSSHLLFALVEVPSDENEARRKRTLTDAQEETASDETGIVEGGGGMQRQRQAPEEDVGGEVVSNVEILQGVTMHWA